MNDKRYIKYSDYTFFVKTKEETFNKFLSLFPANNNTYFFELIKQLYDCLYGGSINLYDDYSNYYSDEYNSFESYLKEHHCLSKNEIAIFNNKNSFYRKTSRSYDNPVYALLRIDKCVNAVEQFIGGEIKDVY